MSPMPPQPACHAPPACSLQCSGYWTRKQLRAQRTGRLIRAYAPRVQRDSAARVIQRFVRGWLGRLAAREVRGAAVTIQRWWRVSID